MKCPFDDKIDHCMYLEDARDHDFLMHPDCPNCPHYNNGVETNPPRYSGWPAYLLIFLIVTFSFLVSAAILLLIYNFFMKTFL